MRSRKEFKGVIRAATLLAILVVALSSITTVVPASVAADNPCGLLTVAEVEDVLGEPLGGPPYRANGTEPNDTGDTCRYETAIFRSVTVGVDWSHGGEIFGLMGLVTRAADTAGLKGTLTLSDGTTMHGAWDEAREFLCCQFHALRGDQQVVIDVAGAKATLEQAAALADKAVRRLDQPLQVDSSYGIGEAAERIQTRPTAESACALVSKAEAQKLVGAELLFDPRGDESGCTFVWKQEPSEYEQELTLLVTWRDGFGEMRRTQAAIGMSLNELMEQGLDVAQDAGDDAHVFDAYAVSIVGVMAVRKDVLLSVESGPASELAARFIAVAAAKL